MTMGGYASSIIFPSQISRVKSREFWSAVSRGVDQSVNPLEKHGVYVEGNMANISKTILINISKTPGIMENVFISADCSPEEIQHIPLCLKSFTMFSPGPMKRCQALTLTLSNMRFIPMKMLSLFEKSYDQ
jgi:hypothetical protein